MPYGFERETYNQCTAKSKQTHERCRRSAVPFTQYDRALCKFHGGWIPAVMEKARKRMEAYDAKMLDPLDPAWVRRAKVRAFEAAEQRYQIARMKKAGTYDDWLRTKAQTKVEDKARRAREKAAQQPKVEVGRVVQYPSESTFDDERWSRW